MATQDEALGARSYPLEDGIPNFLSSPPPRDPSTEAELLRALALAPDLGWRRAIGEAFGASPHVAYVTDARWGAFNELVPVSQTTRVLEIGASLGQQTVDLAARARSVHALEIVPNQAKFAQIRCRQEGRTNVSVAIGGDTAALPYADGAFDLVVLNLVLEWCAGDSSEPHEVGHARLLSSIQRVLAPGGRLFLSTKNRYALHLLAGRPDEHMMGLPFGSALPRSIGRRLLARRGATRAPGHLHSHGALRDLIRRSGLSEVESYWAVPEMRRPKRYVRADRASIAAARSAPGFEHGATNLYKKVLPLVPASLVHLVTPGLTFLARK